MDLLGSLRADKKIDVNLRRLILEGGCGYLARLSSDDLKANCEKKIERVELDSHGEVAEICLLIAKRDIRPFEDIVVAMPLESSGPAVLNAIGINDSDSEIGDDLNDSDIPSEDGDSETLSCDSDSEIQRTLIFAFVVEKQEELASAAANVEKIREREDSGDRYLFIVHVPSELFLIHRIKARLISSAGGVERIYFRVYESAAESGLSLKAVCFASLWQVSAKDFGFENQSAFVIAMDMRYQSATDSDLLERALSELEKAEKQVCVLVSAAQCQSDSAERCPLPLLPISVTHIEIPRDGRKRRASVDSCSYHAHSFMQFIMWKCGSASELMRQRDRPLTKELPCQRCPHLCCQRVSEEGLPAVPANESLQMPSDFLSALFAYRNAQHIAFDAYLHAVAADILHESAVFLPANASQCRTAETISLLDDEQSGAHGIIAAMEDSEDNPITINYSAIRAERILLPSSAAGAQPAYDSRYTISVSIQPCRRVCADITVDWVENAECIPPPFHQTEQPFEWALKKLNRQTELFEDFVASLSALPPSLPFCHRRNYDDSLRAKWAAIAELAEDPALPGYCGVRLLKDVKRFDVIFEYAGVILAEDEYSQLPRRFNTSVQVTAHLTCIDRAVKFKLFGLPNDIPVVINDAHGLPAARVNCTLGLSAPIGRYIRRTLRDCDDDAKLCQVLPGLIRVSAKKALKAGTFLYLNYGRAFWKNHSASCDVCFRDNTVDLVNENDPLNRCEGHTDAKPCYVHRHVSCLQAHFKTLATKFICAACNRSSACNFAPPSESIPTAAHSATSGDYDSESGSEAETDGISDDASSNSRPSRCASIRAASSERKERHNVIVVENDEFGRESERENESDSSGDPGLPPLINSVSDERNIWPESNSDSEAEDESAHDELIIDPGLPDIWAQCDIADFGSESERRHC